jgi:hypothetical protein
MPANDDGAYAPQNALELKRLVQQRLAQPVAAPQPVFRPHRYRSSPYLQETFTFLLLTAEAAVALASPTKAQLTLCRNVVLKFSQISQKGQLRVLHMNLVTR